ncbi:phosphotransferase [Umezawaea sp. Da 62-37]|uniref:phosphotransferase family protein n=1 Tax=Umezawaea sp. Da 62-37 TaxID=3075927 RepID=UPI0028F6F9CC|nr:phosphotransferase [Umezawaea sp. Da 62-37]WNV83674.1 phosphotransferase [Umezawaea sp. Da 62-37]
MHSETKRKLTESELSSITRRATGAGLVEHFELTDGMFNAAHRLTTDDGRVVVLKVAPPPGTPLMTYERDIMRTEAMAFRLMGEHGVPVPEVLHVEDGLLVMSCLDGGSWASLEQRITPGARAALRRELGGIVARLHRIGGDSFGYPQGPGGDTWRGAFLAMAASVLADAEVFGVGLPEGLSDWFQDRSAVLDEVTTPVLVHFDLWPGNIFVDPATPEVVGIIDPERAFWGDPLADFVSLALFGDIEDEPDFLAGYGGMDMTPSRRERVRLYRVYLYLIMIVEGAPRGFVGAEHEESRRFYRGKLAADLAGDPAGE